MDNYFYQADSDDRQAEEAEFAAWVKDLEFAAGELNHINELLKEASCEYL